MVLVLVRVDIMIIIHKYANYATIHVVHAIMQDHYLAKLVQIL